ncbi:MAG: ATP phosphoribosyltransferase regulatory subunit, partial [Rhodospirillales bacterium]|nr:ATP phosphoribosyltransferase regulatory subunit [Rhodospirillales bacterium]
MTELERRALLPDGLRDMLPPTAGFEADVIERLIGHFAGLGYARVKAPLVEFEEGLLSGAGAAMSGHIFRLMDPVSQRMMGVRADITPQIARIASTRLKNEPRPLRLSYSGEVLRIRGTQLQPERQFAQVGVELIGRETAAADAEVIVMAAEALTALGVVDFSIDLTIPTLVPALCDALGLADDKRDELRAALDRKDAEVVHRLDDPR